MKLITCYKYEKLPFDINRHLWSFVQFTYYFNQRISLTYVRTLVFTEQIIGKKISQEETNKLSRGGVLPYMAYTGMCGPKGYGYFSRFGHT